MQQAKRRTWPDDLITDEQWRVYHEVISRASAKRLRLVLGGGFAISTYTGHWRNTKDLDLYVLPAERDALIQVTSDVGLHDMYERSPYDRRWIYRSACGDTIVDIIWAMANLRSQVDEGWLRDGGEFNIRGERLGVVPPEEMVWNKLYVMQHDRCDWTDVLNLLYSVGADLDWEYLIKRMGDDTPLLAAALSVYRWMCPGRSRAIPGAVWERLQVPPPRREAVPEIDWHHSTLLDVRPWFAVVESR
jgi:Nucleotidyl transferase of unknown function (DUF2204)